MARRSTISRDDVVDAALEIIDADDGVGSLSLEAIAKRLGVRGPSLYHYFTDKNEILDAVAARVIGNLDMRHGSDNWVEWLIERALQFQARVMEHPGAATLLMEHLNPRAAEIGFARGARMLGEAGVPVELHGLLLHGAQHLTWGASLYRAFSATHPPPVALDADRYPELLAARAADPDDGLQSLERAVRGFITGVLIEHAMHGGSRSAADAVADALAVIEPTKEAS